MTTIISEDSIDDVVVERLTTDGRERLNEQGEWEPLPMTPADAAAIASHAHAQEAAEVYAALGIHSAALIEAQAHTVQDALTTGQIDRAYNNSLGLAVEPLVRRMKALPTEYKTVPMMERRADMEAQALALLHLHTEFDRGGAAALAELLGLAP